MLRCWDRHDHKLIASCLIAALDPFAPADRQNIARLFSPLSKQLQLQHYSRKPVVEHTIYERPLMAQRAEEVNFSLAVHIEGEVSANADPLMSGSTISLWL